MLELKNISKYYNAGTVNEMCLFNDFNLSIDDGEFVSVVGSNGSGTTSMLNLICGSIPVDSGTITMGGVDITKMPEYKRQRRIANCTGKRLVDRSPAGKNATLQLVLDNVQHVLSDMHRKEQQCPRLRRLPNKRTCGKRLGMVDAKRINPYVGIHHYFEGSPAHRIIPFWR